MDRFYSFIYFRQVYIIQRECEKFISNFDFAKVNPIINSSVVVRKELCWWDPKIDGVEDYDLWIRIRKQNKRFYNCPQITVKHRVHNLSAFNSGGKKV